MIYALGVITFVLGLALSVALHECGHFFPARRFGVKVTQFFVGFGPTVWSRQRGEVEYGLKAFPLGGFVRLVGMLPPAPDTDPHEVRKADTGLFTQMATDARTAEYEHVTDADLDRLFYRKPVWQKVVVMLGGPTVNLVLAVLFFSIAFMGFGANGPTTTVAGVADCVISQGDAGRKCTEADPVSPAKAAGLQAGDDIVAFDGIAVDTWRELTDAIRANGSEVATIEFMRDGQRMSAETTTTVLVRASLDDPKKEEAVGFLGVAPTFELQRQGIWSVTKFVGTGIKATALSIAHLPERMVDATKAAFGAERDPDGPISVVGASRVAGELVTVDDPSWAERSVRILSLLGSLNLFLWMFNLIPLLPLDGGHVAGALWEGARRRWAAWRGAPDPGYVDVAKMLPLAYAVGTILIAMSVILIYADIVNPVKLT